MMNVFYVKEIVFSSLIDICIRELLAHLRRKTSDLTLSSHRCL